MGIVGFSFSKLDCVRKKAPTKGSIEIKHNISVKDVKKSSLSMGGSKNEVLKIEFAFDIVYGSGIGKVALEGDVLYTDTKEIVDETAKSFEKDKKLTAMVNAHVHKFVFNKSIVKAIELADSLGLPSPVPLPKIQFSKENK